jgi:hypothetical protein
MFCPKCGLQMNDNSGGKICVEGKMELSPLLSSQLAECFIEKSYTPSDAALERPTEETWFCPACRVKMDMSEVSVTCQKCNQSLNQFIRQLTELYVHL